MISERPVEMAGYAESMIKGKEVRNIKRKLSTCADWRTATLCNMNQEIKSNLCLWGENKPFSG